MQVTQTSMQYTIIVVGDSGCGKTQFISRMHTGEFFKVHVPTIGCPVTTIHERTNRGDITFNAIETTVPILLACTQNNISVENSTLIHVDGAICMIDLQNPEGLSNVMRNIESLENLYPNIPIILCGNKCDVKDRKVSWKSIRQLVHLQLVPSKDKTVHKRAVLANISHYPYYDVSARTNYHLSKPWMDLAKIISGHTDLEYEDFDTIAPPEVVLKGGKLTVR